MYLSLIPARPPPPGRFPVQELVPLCEIEHGAQVPQRCQRRVHASVFRGWELEELAQALRQGSGEQAGGHVEVLACQVGGCNVVEVGMVANRVLADERLEDRVSVKQLGAASACSKQDSCFT